ncbi:MAG: hypothetical protein RLY20_3560 [Verrucomicrobiota bacterium]|jgi:hypothetical protein
MTMKAVTLVILIAALAFDRVVAEKLPAKPVKTQHAGKIAETEKAGDDLIFCGAKLEREGQAESALQLYGQAAAVGNREGAFRAGHLGLERAIQAKGKARILGLDMAFRYLHQAATNGHPDACLHLAQALRDGSEITKDLTQAYAWMVTAQKFDPSIPITVLDQFVVDLDAAALQEAQVISRRWLSGNWPERVTPRIIEGDSRLKISGGFRGAKIGVLINRKTFMLGDSAFVTPVTTAPKGSKNAPAELEITCTAIGPDFVLISIAGETDLRLLSLDLD